MVSSDLEKSWVDFDAMEVEEARAKRKDPRSFSQIFCWKQCVTGPQDKSTSPKVVNAINIFMIAFNLLALTYTFKGSWTWLVSLNIFVGLIS